ncbi:Glucosidase 2 subunit [Nesidiocoris tenuis]|uniref:Glucosidase 2 subunit beta n=1 Tax=Nesidiocoris tenuis TaxID=355587 RepID=A0ABN7AFW2_9HEMI|nr:Glucosidase 2 subunit [Nesidiocoris tenuis]
MYIEQVCILFMLSLAVHCVNDIPRGVPYNASSLYKTAGDFNCFDGSSSIPSSYINDGYCDCADGSDEPGTSACPSGFFYCINAGHVGEYIRSSLVDDGICDCCDGSDERYRRCENICGALSDAARAEAEARAKIISTGSEVRQKLIHQARQMRLQKEDRLRKLEEEKVEAEKLKEAAEAHKNAAEEAENAALQIYRQKEEEIKQERIRKEKEDAWREAHNIFINLDSNQNGLLDVEELKVKQIFDRNKDGEVSDEEIQWYLELKEDVTEDVFHSSIWQHIKPFYMMEMGLFTPPETHNENGAQDAEEEEPLGEGGKEQVDEDEKQDDDEEEDDSENVGEGEVIPQNNDEGEPSPAEPEYDPRTLELMEAAKEARSEFDSSNQALQSLEQEISQIKEKLSLDYGPEDEFAPLDGQCFTHTDREYIYKLCLFNQVTQAPKSDGSEIRLGAWSGWVEANGKSAMLYDKGQSCWNGPQRSTTVLVECGSDNELLSVSEPNKCEYLMQFKTPAACKPIEDPDQGLHDEL